MAVYIPIVDLLMFLLFFVALCLIYMAYEITKMKKIVGRLESAETKFEEDENMLHKLFGLKKKKVKPVKKKRKK